MPLTVPETSAPRALKLNDVDLRQRRRGQDAGTTPSAELRVRPKVQGAALVLENKTGRILAMVGGFSYPLSQLNRTTQARASPARRSSR